jgi:von Willebrand factor type D domain
MLTNGGNVYFGNGGLTGPATLSVGGLVNTGQLQVIGNYTSSTQGATLYVNGLAGFGTTGVLTGSVLIDGYGVVEFAGGGQIGTIASGAALDIRSFARLADAGQLGSNSALTGLTENDGNLALRYGNSINIAGNLRNTGNIYLQDADNNTIVSSNTIAGTLTNSGNVYLGSGGLTAPTTLSVGGLVNTGLLQVVGNYSTSTQGATLYVGGLAGFGTTGVLTGSVFIDGYGVVEFAGGGQIGTIASGAVLEIRSAGELADAGQPGSNSALTGLTENDGNFAIRYGNSVNIAGNLRNTGNIYLQDADNNAIVSSNTIAGTLTNSGNVYLGSGGLTAPATLSVGGLVNTGLLQVIGNYSTSTQGATLYVGGLAGFGTTGVLTGSVFIDGYGVVEFAGDGQIGTIASGAVLELRAFGELADVGQPGSNSALTGLTENDGNFAIRYGNSINIAGNLRNTGNIYLQDADNNTIVSRNTIVGTLTNSGNIYIGNAGLTAPTTLSVGGLVNTGAITLNGNSQGAPTNTATLDVASAAGFGTTGVLTGNVSMNGAANLEFESGSIRTIAAGAQLTLFGAALLTNRSDTTHNSALTGLLAIGGNFDFAYGETLAIGNDVSILSSGRWNIDGDGFTAQGGSDVTIAGTLDNAGNLGIGVTTGGLAAPTRVTADALVNTGAISLMGNFNGTPTNTATLDIASAAGFGTLGVLTGNVSMNGAANLEFASGSIHTIAAGAQLTLFGAALLTNKSDTKHNSALTGLSAIGGNFDFAYGETLAIGNDVSILSGGRWNIDGDGFTSQGGSDVTIAGTLNNAGNLGIGVTTGGLAAPTRVTADALVNTGAISLIGNFNGAPTNTATLDIASAAGFGTLGVLTGNVAMNGAANLEFASGSIHTIAAGAQLTLYGAALVTNKSDTAHNSALSGLSAIGGYFDLAYGQTLSVGNDISILSGGRWNIDGDGFTSEGGSSVTIAGTLDNAGNLGVGVTTGGSTAPTRVTADALVNSGAISLIGNFNGAPTNTATLDIASSAGFGTLGVLTGNVSMNGAANLEFASGSIHTIAAGAQLTLYGAALVTNKSDTAHNSALSGLSAIGGYFDLAYGQTLSLGNDVSILSGGRWNIDGDGFTTEGGSSVTIAGTLDNAGNLGIGVTTGGQSAPTRVTADVLVNTGAISLIGNFNGAPTNTATLDIASAAGFGTLGVLTGNISMNGAANLEFASGSIHTIAAGAQLTLYGAAVITNAADTTHNSALSGLSAISGNFDFAYGETLAIGNNISILSGGRWNIDGDGFTSQGGSSVTIAGTLDNAGALSLGVPTGGLASSTSVTAAGLINTGNIDMTGNGTAEAVLRITGNAVNSDVIDINGGATLFAGTYTQIGGDTDVGGAVIANAMTLAGGSLHGTGLIDPSIVDTGAVIYGGSNGNTPGTLAIAGGLTINGSGELYDSIDGTGTAQASEVSVQGPVSLVGGTLAVSTVGGFQFAAGETFTVLTATPGQLSGSFGALVVNGILEPGAGSELIGGGLYLTPVYDDQAGTVSVRITSTPYHPPTVAAPASELLNLGSVTAIHGISITANQPGTVSVQVADTSGVLAVTQAGNATVTGDHSSSLTLTGDVADVNQELASLTETAQGSALTDSLVVTATDSALQTANTIIAVSINHPPELSLPPSAFEAPGGTEPLSGIRVSDADAIASGETLHVVLSDSAGKLSATQSGSGIIAGAGSTHLTLTGNLTDVNAELASLTFNGTTGDTLAVSVDDGRGLSANGTLAVGVSGPLTFNAPTSLSSANGFAQPVTGVSVTAPANAPANLVTTITISSQNGTLATSQTTGVTASGDHTGTLSLTGTIGDLNTALQTLTYTAPPNGSADTIKLATPSGTGTSTTQSVPVTLTPAAPPVLTIPGASANVGVLTPIDGLSVANATGLPINTQMTLVLSDATALLGLQFIQPGASVNGTNSTALTLIGTAAEIDADLAQLTFVDSNAAAAGSNLDTITIRATADGATATGSLSVFVPPLGLSSSRAETAPTFLDYTGALPAGAASNVGAISHATGNLLTFFLPLPHSGPVQFAIGAYNPDPNTIGVNFEITSTAVGFSTVDAGGAPIEGLAPLSLSYLMTAVDQAPKLGDTITYVIKSTDYNGAALPDERITVHVGTTGKPGTAATPFPSTKTTDGKGPTPYIVTPNGFSFPKSVIPHSQGGSLETHLREISPTVSPEPTPTTSGDDDGDVHLTTFDGLLYNFQAVGEFVLAKSTAPGDSFQVQIRTAPWYQGAFASVTVAVAASVGANRVTFDLSRQAVVWVDGHPVTLAPGGTPIDLGQGTLQELTASSWAIRWDSGETLLVTNEGSFLDVHTTLTPKAAAGTVQGLLGSHNHNLTNEFVLPNGTLLQQPLSFTDLYTTWANAWRLTQAASLLDYGSGQTTGSFTDLNYPTDAQPLSLFPPELVAQAQSLVAAAGITNPALQQAAVEDYLLTGDKSFITADAQGTAPTAVAQEPTSPNAPNGVGIGVVAPVVVESASGNTAVSFEVYRLGNTGTAQVIDYVVQGGSAGAFGPTDFAGGVLPSGQVTIAAGSTMATFAVDITSHLGTVVAESLTVGISTGTNGTPVLAPTASVDVVNPVPQPGIAAVPEFLNVGQVGTLTHVGNSFTLDLGTFDRDSVPGEIEVELINGGSVGADLLSGILAVSKPNGLGVSSGTGPVTDQGAGGYVLLPFQLSTASDGTFQQRVLFDANESNSSGYQANLGTLSLTVLATVGTPPTGAIVPSTIDFGAVHQHGSVSQALTIVNTSNTELIASAATSGSVTDNVGSVTVAPNATDSSSLRVSLDTTQDGVRSGTVVLPFGSSANAGASSAILLQPNSVSASGSFSNGASLLSDGIVSAPGTPDSSAQAVSWTDLATTFTYNFGSVQLLDAALVSVDRTGTYVVSSSTDDVHFTSLFTITPLSGASTGLGARSSLQGSPYYDASEVFAPTEAQYVRLQAIGGAGTYAASELDLFAATPTVAVTGTVYAEAAPVVSIAQPIIVHVGDAGTLALHVANDAPTDGFGEKLIAAITGTPTGGFITGSVSATGEIAAGASGSLTLDFSTAHNGIISGTVNIGLTSDGGTGPGSIDGLGTTALPTQTVAPMVTVDAYANPEFAFASTLGTVVNGTLDIGAFEHGGSAFTFGIGVENNVTGPVDLLSGSVASSGGFQASGIGSIGTLAGGQTYSALSFTLPSVNDGVVTQMITLTPTDSNASGFSTILPTETLTLIGTVADLPSPVISVPQTQTLFAGTPAVLGPINITDTIAGNGMLTAVITDATGLLSAAASGGGSVSGNNSHRLVLTGNLADLNTELASLAYASSVIGDENVTIDVTDYHMASASQTISVETDPVPTTAPVLNVPFAAFLLPGQPSGIPGISITDPSAEASGEQITLTLTAEGLDSGPITVSGGPGGTVIGNGTTVVSITGTVKEVNSYLSDGVTESILQDAYKKAQETAKMVQETYGKAWALFFGLSTGALADGLAGAGTEFGKFLEDQLAEHYHQPTPENLGGDLLAVNAGLFSFAANVLNDVAALAAGATSFPPPAGEGGGETHIVTYSGQLYQLDAEGDYLLTGSTSPSDSFTVEARLSPLNNSQSASIISQIGAEVGTDRVTIGIDRASIVMIDGKAVDLTTGTPMTLSGGQITELTSNTYQITWSTGEILTVTDYSDFLNVKVGLGSNDAAGSLIGLMGPDNGASNDFTLPDGSVATIATTSDLYNFAHAYLIGPADTLLDGASTNNLTFPQVPLTLADFPTALIDKAAQAVASAGITDPGAQASAELDYLISGGNMNFVAADQTLFQGVSTTVAPIAAPPTVALLGVLPAAAEVNVNENGVTPVVFDVELTQAQTVATTVNFSVIDPNSGDLTAADFGGTFPSGSVTIAAGQTSAQFTVDVPKGALGSLPSADVAVQISTPSGISVYGPTASESVVTPQPGSPPVPTFTYLTSFGSFINDGGGHYTLDLGAVQYGQPLPTLTFGIENAGTGHADLLSGTFTVDPVEGFTVNGTTLPGTLAAGQSYNGLTATINTIKFGDNSETITFNPVDSNTTGYSAPMAPVTLTITDTLELPTVTYSQAWGDVHIITYNGLTYDFQAVGDYTLAQSRIPGDTFDISLNLQPWSPGASVTTIHQVAIILGPDTATFDWARSGAGSADPVWVDHAPLAFAIGQTQTLAGGTITEVSPDVFKVDWNTGEMMTVTNTGSYINVVDGVPPGDLSGGVAGLQGEGEGAANDFQLNDGEILPQPIAQSVLYGEYLQSWEAPTSLFDGPAPPFEGPVAPLTLADLPANVVAQAAAVVAAAGITNPDIARAAELDFLATGDPSFVTSAAAAQQQASTVLTSTPTVIANNKLPAIGVIANAATVTETSSGTTPVTFTAYITSTQMVATDVHYTVIGGGVGFLGTAAFGGTFPSGDVIINAGAGSATFQIAVPDAALAGAPVENLQVKISSGSGNATALPVFPSTAQTEIVSGQPVAGTPPDPMFSELSGGGTLTFDSSTDTYTLDLGTLIQDAQLPTIQIALDNAATAPADLLGGAFTVPLGGGFSVSGASLKTPIAAGASYTGLQFTIDTSTLGSNTMTLGFNPKDINASGYDASLGKITLKIEDTIATPAAAAINTPQTIIFNNVRVGTADSQHVSITNTAPAPAANLDVTPYANGDAVATGTISALAPGKTDAFDISVGITTSAAGRHSGVVGLGAVSDAGGGNTSPILPFTPVDVFGAVYRMASASVAPVTKIVHVGDSGTVILDIANTATADGFSESLIASLGSVTGGFTGLATGPTGDIVAGGSNTSAIRLGFDTSQAGTISGTATLALLSDGGIGTNSIDGLGTIALDPLMAPINVIVDNYATAAVSSAGNLTQTGTNTFLLNLGTAAVSHGALTAGFTITNSATGPADLLNGTFATKGPTSFSDLGLGAFSDIGAGESLIAGTISLSELNAGVFSQTITVVPTDTNASGYSGKIGGETITVVGTIVAPTGSGSGDVHFTTFSGLHYNFQSVGDFVLERSTQPGNDFEVQIETAPGTSAVSLTTKVAAQVGADVITFASDRPDMVWINGHADTGLSGPNAVQTFAGGQIKELSPTQFKLTWATGESLTVVNPGTFEGVSYLNTALALGPNDPPGSIQGLLGSNTGQANDFQLPDGTVLLQPVSQQELIGPFATSWAVSSSTSLLDDSTNAMHFLASSDAGELRASAANQVLQATGGITTMSDPNHLGAVFQGALVALSDLSISSFSTKDKIDVTGTAGATAQYTGTDTSGTLLVSSGTVSGSIHLSGQLSGAAFHVASDQHGGSMITYS